MEISHGENQKTSLCPACGIELLTQLTQDGTTLNCAQCGGQLIHSSILRRMTKAEFAQALFSNAKKKSDRLCPRCHSSFSSVHLLQVRTDLDVCKNCNVIWFDAFESSRLPDRQGQLRFATSLNEAYRNMGIAIAREMNERIDFENIITEEAPDRSWKVIPAMLGMPVKTNSVGVHSVSGATWFMLALMISGFFLSMKNPLEVYKTWAFFPQEPWRHYSITWISNLFLHAGFFHLFFNAYFFLTFARETEQILGHWKFLALFLLAGIGGNFLHYLAAYNQQSGLIGASGAITGIVAFFVVSFPFVRISRFLGIRFVSYPVVLWAMMFFAMQIVMSFRQASNANIWISYLGHMGGAIVGTAFAIINKAKKANDFA